VVGPGEGWGPGWGCGWLGRELGLPFAAFPCFPTYPLRVVFFSTFLFPNGVCFFLKHEPNLLGTGLWGQNSGHVFGLLIFSDVFPSFFPGCGENILILKQVVFLCERLVFFFKKF
jgi:hypothetical protein